MMPGYPPQQQSQRYNPYRQPPQQQGLSHMPYPTQQQPTPMQGQSVMGQQPPMGQAPVGQSPMQQPPLVWQEHALVYNGLKIVCGQDLWQGCVVWFVTIVTKFATKLCNIMWQDCVILNIMQYRYVQGCATYYTILWPDCYLWNCLSQDYMYMYIYRRCLWQNSVLTQETVILFVTTSLVKLSVVVHCIFCT